MRKLLLLLLVPLSLTGLYVPQRLGNVFVANMHDGFAVLKKGKLHHIESDCLDATLRQMNFKQRNEYIIKGGAMILNQAHTGEYTLKTGGNLKGGGPILGWICYGVVIVSGSAVIAVVKHFDRSGTAPTDKMFECVKSVAKVAQSFGNTAPTPVH